MLGNKMSFYQIMFGYSDLEKPKLLRGSRFNLQVWFFFCIINCYCISVTSIIDSAPFTYNNRLVFPEFIVYYEYR